MFKESTVDHSSAFQHASEFIVNNVLMNEAFLMLQGDGRFDCNCTRPRNFAATLMMIVILRLEHVMPMKNSSVNSLFNPV